MAVYDNRQMNKMRQDAIRRSQEMHRRSMVNTAHYSQGQQNRGDMPPNQPQQESESLRKESVSFGEANRGAAFSSHPKKDGHMIPDVLSRMFEGKIDSDKLIIIALMVILAREGADMKLILALGYILL